MIVYPEGWNQEYSCGFVEPSKYADRVLKELESIVRDMNVCHLAYSGGVDSTIMLCLLTSLGGLISTYTIASREDHPDILFARQGAKLFGSNHHEFIVDPSESLPSDNLGDNAVRQFFGEVKKYTNRIICCDGIDEYMCGYYDHMEDSLKYYLYYMSRLLPDHLLPLNKASENVEVYLPYLDEHVINIMKEIPLMYKVTSDKRKIIVSMMAKNLGIPDEFIYRNKYGFCDVFRECDK